MGGRVRGIFSAAFDYLLDKIIESWPLIAAWLVVGGGATYVASASSELGKLGIVTWTIFGLSSATIFLIGLLIYGNYLAKKATANYMNTAARHHSTNVLAPTHTREQIQLVDFYHPFFRPTDHVRFEDCDILGPGNMALEGGTFSNVGFTDCEIVIVRPDRGISGAMLFRNPTFLRSRLYRVTFVMNHETYKKLPKEFKAGVQVVSDGTVGDL